MRNRLAPLLCFLLGACGGASPPADPAAPERADDGPPPAAVTSFDVFGTIDRGLGERLWPDEARAISQTIDVIQRFLQRRFDEGRVDERGKHVFMRDAHAKAHGCVRGQLSVRADVPADLRAGVFAAARSYPVWIRFSNGNSEVRADELNDARGMAIKVIGVAGDKVIPDFPESTTQDFVQINHPVFFVDDPNLYLKTLKVFHSGAVTEGLGQAASLVQMPLLNQALALAVNGSRVADPLKEVYWSMVPIRNAPEGGAAQAVKYATIPVACDDPRLPADLASQRALIDRLRARNHKSIGGSIVDALTEGRDSLREAMTDTLEFGDACFVLALQRFLDQAQTPVEQSVVNWDDVSPFVPVADLVIPQQRFGSEAQDAFCQNLSFTPWHALPAHKPLGAINRTRLLVYKAISQFRRAGNQVPAAQLAGPTGAERFE